MSELASLIESVDMTKAITGILIFAVCAVLFIWNKLPQAFVAVLGLVAMIAFNVCTFSEGFKNFSGYIVVLICSMMVVGKATFDTGLAGAVANRIVRLARGKERMVLFLSVLLTGVLSAFLSNIATLAIMISILTGVCASNKAIRFKNVVMPVGMAAVMGGAATLVGSTPQMTAQGILEERGLPTFGIFTFSAPGFVIIVLLAIYAALIGYPLGKKIWGGTAEYEESPVVNDEEKKLGTGQPKYKMVVMAVIFVALVVLFILAGLPRPKDGADLGFLTAILEWMDAHVPALKNLGFISLLCAVACVATGCISHKNAIKSINWELALWFCATLGIAAGLEIGGGGTLMAYWVLSLLGEHMTPLLLFVVFTVLVALLTQVLSNSTVLTITLPVALPIAISLGYDPFPLAVGMTMASAMAVATPLANSTIGMTMVAKYKFSDYFKYGGPITVIAVLIILVMVPMLWPLAG